MICPSFKNLLLSSSFNFFKSITEGDYKDVNYDSDNVSWFTRLNSTLTFKDLFDWQTTAMYMGPSQGAQTKRDGMVSINLAFSKDLRVIMLRLASRLQTLRYFASAKKEVPAKAKNVILLIGDGMGLSQVSSAFYFKDSSPNLARFNSIGLINALMLFIAKNQKRL